MMYFAGSQSYYFIHKPHLINTETTRIKPLTYTAQYTYIPVSPEGFCTDLRFEMQSPSGGLHIIKFDLCLLLILLNTFIPHGDVCFRCF